MGDKQTQAVICNFKEQSRLEKALAMLKIEEAYALSLINLDSKVLKIGYKRLKDRVGKTKSHLTNDQINEMKVLEENGEIKEKTIKMESEIRIAAAEKRLKLWSDKKANSVTPTPRAQTAKARLETEESRRSYSPAGSNSLHSTMEMKQHIKAVHDMRRKSIDIRDSLDAMEAAFKQTDKESARSVTHTPQRHVSINSNNADESAKQGRKSHVKTNAFMRIADEPVKRQKSLEFRNPTEEIIEPPSPKIADDTMQFDKESVPILKHGADSSRHKHVANLKPTDEINPAVPVMNKSGSIRPQTGHPSLRSKTAFVKKRPATSLINASRDRSNDKRRLSQMITRTPFSSHDLDQDEKKSAFDSPFRSIREGTLTAHDEKTIDKDMGEEIHKAIKKEFIRKEAATSLHIEDKIDTFFERVDEYVNGEGRSSANEVKIHVPVFRKAGRDERKSPPRRNNLRRRELEQAIHNKGTNKILQGVFS